MRTLLLGQSGQTLPIVMMAMVLAVFLVVPAVTYSGTALTAQRLGKNELIEDYSRASAVTYTMWRLLDSTYAAQSSATETVTVNGLSITTTMTKVPASNATLVDQTDSVSMSETLPLGNELWIVVGTNDSSGNGVYLAYDTAAYPASLRVPWTAAGTQTHYLHSSPTPPVSDTVLLLADTDYTNPSLTVEALTSSLVAPVGSTLYNYDVNRDSVLGRWITSAATPANCEDKALQAPGKRIIWRVTPPVPGDGINGNVEFRWWWGREDGTFGNHSLDYYLCKYDPTKQIRNTGGPSARNPQNIGPGRVSVTSGPVWVAPYDLSASLSGSTLNARVDRTGNDTVAIRSWQLQ